VRGTSDTHGERFAVRVPVIGPNGKTIEVLTAWIYDKGKYRTKMSTIPRLATIYIDKKGVRDFEEKYPRT
jgi:hypothetical protein